MVVLPGKKCISFRAVVKQSGRKVMGAAGGKRELRDKVFGFGILVSLCRDMRKEKR